MGYQRPILRLKFEDPEMAGLEVMCRRPSVKKVEEYSKSDRNLEVQVGIIAECLISWNLEDENGDPVPTSAESLLDQDQPFLIALLDAWMGQAIKVSGPLGSDSPSGEPSPEVSIPMEPLSPNPLS